MLVYRRYIVNHFTDADEKELFGKARLSPRTITLSGGIPQWGTWSGDKLEIRV